MIRTAGLDVAILAHQTLIQAGINAVQSPAEHHLALLPYFGDSSMFITITMNHIQAVKAWAEAHGALINLNLLTFELEVKTRNRYFTLHPQFLARIDGRLMHVTRLVREVTGFIGWLPYRPLRWPLASDKLVFKTRLSESGLATPRMWQAPREATTAFVVKRSVGSFGRELAGPYHPGQEPDAVQMQALTKPGSAGSLYAESFVQGTNIKVWFWGERAIHAQLHPYPLIHGNGRDTIAELIETRLKDIQQSWQAYPEKQAVMQALAYQGLDLNAVLPLDLPAWLDYRYGRRFSAEAATGEDDNALPQLPAAQTAQVEAAGRWIAGELEQELNAPVLCSLDGVLDTEGKIWWLEANSNPMFPPTGYPAMFSTLFGTPVAVPGPGSMATPVSGQMVPDMMRGLPNGPGVPAAHPAGLQVRSNTSERIAA